MTDHPWLERSRWPGGRAESRGMARVIPHWVGAVIWNGFAAAIVVAVGKQGWSELPFFLQVVLAGFMAMGIPLIAGALVQTARVMRFRNLRLELDPFPGSIGGQAGGYIDLPIRSNQIPRIRATLHCVHSHMRGSGEDRSRREDVVWASEMQPEIERSGTSTRIRVTFDVPDLGQPESERSDDYDPSDHHYWSVHVAAELTGADLDESFRVPVYRIEPPMTAHRPALGAPAAGTPTEGERVSARGIHIGRDGTDLVLDFGRSRYGLVGIGLVVFGLLTMSSGAFAFTQTSGAFGLLGVAFGGVFLVVFGLVGLLCVALGLYKSLSRISVRIGNGRVRSTHAFGPFRRTREVPISQLSRMEAKVTMQAGQGPSARTSYTIRGVQSDGGKILLGDGIRGAYLLDTIRTLLEEETGTAMEVALRSARPGRRRP